MSEKYISESKEEVIIDLVASITPLSYFWHGPHLLRGTKLPNPQHM